MYEPCISTLSCQKVATRKAAQRLNYCLVSTFDPLTTYKKRGVLTNEQYFAQV